jgi:hypothetical protein
VSKLVLETISLPNNDENWNGLGSFVVVVVVVEEATEAVKVFIK